VPVTADLSPRASGAAAQLLLGFIYEEGKNYAEAAKWYRLAADQGDAGAQYNLGTMYDFGRGVRQNYAEAVRWYRFAAGQGMGKSANRSH